MTVSVDLAEGRVGDDLLAEDELQRIPPLPSTALHTRPEPVSRKLDQVGAGARRKIVGALRSLGDDLVLVVAEGMGVDGVDGGVVGCAVSFRAMDLRSRQLWR